MKSPPRLLKDDPGFARLVDAMRKDAPSTVQMSKALSLATKVAALPPMPTPGGAWLGRTWIQSGLTIVGVSAVVGALAASSLGSRHAAAPSAPASFTTAASQPMPVTATATANAPSEAGVASVSIEDLPVAPVEHVAALENAHVERAEPTAAEANAKAKARHVGVPPGRPAEVAARAPATPSGGATGKGTFSEELALTSQARAALERGDFVACLGAVDRYQRSFRSGVFAQEIDVIRIEALAKSGARARAHASSERFLVTNAASPYADRVRSVFNNTKD